MFERGELLLVPYPFSDLSATKHRPVLALTGPDSYGDFIALPVTSRPQAEFGVPLNSADLVRGALPAPSWIRIDRIVTLNSTLVAKIIGRVRDNLVSESIERFCAHIGYRK